MLHVCIFGMPKPSPGPSVILLLATSSTGKEGLGGDDTVLHQLKRICLVQNRQNTSPDVSSTSRNVFKEQTEQQETENIT